MRKDPDTKADEVYLAFDRYAVLIIHRSINDVRYI